MQNCGDLQRVSRNNVIQPMSISLSWSYVTKHVTINALCQPTHGSRRCGRSRAN